MKITGDGGYDAEVAVKDILGSQVIKLPKPFEGKRLKVEVVDSFLGRFYQDLVISELRFFDGKTWFMLDPTGRLKDGIASNRALFAKAKVDSLLNDSYSAQQELKHEPFWMSSKLRLRADGSFYLSGSIGEAEGSGISPWGTMRLRRFPGKRAEAASVRPVL